MSALHAQCDRGLSCTQSLWIRVVCVFPAQNIRSPGHGVLRSAEEVQPDQLPTPLPPLDDGPDELLLREKSRAGPFSPDAHHEHFCSHDHVHLLLGDVHNAQIEGVHVVEEVHHSSAAGKNYFGDYFH